MKREILGVVMCGGESRRMGENKALLEARPGKRQIDYALELLGQVCFRSAAATGPADRVSLPLPEGALAVPDAPELSGPVAGVVAALEAAGGWPILLVACDMPYIEVSMLVQLVNRRDPDKQATAFRAADGRPEPMCAIYEPVMGPLLRARARAGMDSLRGALEAADLELIDLDRPELLASVNDRSELDRARRELS